MQEAQLRQQVEQFGAPEIEEDKPGLFRTLVDLLSRPNYATAGMVEELLNGRSITSGVSRALSEIFSGVGGVQGQKRAFGEVLEGQGVGTKTLADAFPALEGTWVGHMGSRGAAGIALDIVTDPLTYMTFGAWTGTKIATSKGIRYLNKSGAKRLGEIKRKNIALAKDSLKSTDDIAVTKMLDEVVTASEKEFESLYKVGDDISSEFLEKGGAKLFGHTIPGSDKLGVPLHKAMSMLPDSISKPAIEGATQMREGMYRMMRGIFSPEGALANLPQPMRERAVRLTNSFFRSSMAHRGHLMSQKAPLEKIYRKLEKADPNIGERWHDIREGIRPKSDIKTAEELDTYEKAMALYGSMGTTLWEHGVLADQQILPKYIFHQYKNVEDLAQYHPRPGVKLEPGSKAVFEKERKFESFREAQEVSRELHEQALQKMSKGEADRLYPILEPEWDVFKNMDTYINQHADVLARKAWREQMASEFGKKLDDFDLDAVHEAALAGKMSKTTKGAPKEFSPENVPLKRAIDEDDVEETLRRAFGEDDARYVAVKSKITDDELVYLPKGIAKAMESVDSSLFNTKDYKEFGKMLKGFDWLNNNFKWGNYTIWPASLARDGYSNVFLSMLRIGFAALNPRNHTDAVLLMAGKNLKQQFKNTGYTIGELRGLSKTLGVWVPGQVFVEQTGRFKLGPTRRALTEARASVENEARVLLWMEEIARGADPRSAADTVGQFLFNYGEVSRVERDLFRRLIPFYTFTRKNVELQWKQLRRNPGMQINQVKPFRGHHEENEQMVKWEAEAMKLRMDKDGKTLHALTGIDLPLRNVDTIWAGGFQSTGRRLTGMITPLIKTLLIEGPTGQELFTNRNLTRTQSGLVGRAIDTINPPKAIKDWLGYKKEMDDAGRPSYSFDGARFNVLFRSWMFSRMISTSDRQFREYAGDDNWARALLDLTTGLRVKDIDFTDQQRKRYRTRIRQLEDSLVRRGRFRTFAKNYRDKNPGEFE
jgi:hypothetical protein